MLHSVSCVRNRIAAALYVASVEDGTGTPEALTRFDPLAQIRHVGFGGRSRLRKLAQTFLIDCG